MTDQEVEDFLAEKVMGWRLDCLDTAHERKDLFEAWITDGDNPYVACWRHSWHPVSEISQAWQVLEKCTDPKGIGIQYDESGRMLMRRFFDMCRGAELYACSAQEAATEICLIACECLGVDATEKG